MKLDFSGKTVVLTGGGGVLCSTAARAFGECGANVVIIDLLEEAAKKAEKSVPGYPDRTLAITADVLSKESMQSAARAIVEKFGTVDVLINGAGGNRKNATTSPELTFFDLDVDEIRKVFDLNFLGTFIPSQVFGKIMAKQGAGVIINIASMNAFRPLTRIPGYSAAKAAVANFTQWLAVYMSQEVSKNIRVLAVAPGFFLTHQNRFLLIDEKTGKPTPRGKTILDHTPMGRYGKPEELASVLLWLASDASSFIHGVVIPIDGGFNAFSGV